MAPSEIKMLSAFDSPLLLSAAGFLIIVSVVRFLLIRAKKLDLPVVEVPGDGDQRKALIEGSERYPDSPFIIQSKSPIVILPRSVINEVRNLPEDQASFAEEIRISMAEDHTGIGTSQPVTRAIKQDLTRNIASTLDDLQDEVVYGFDQEFGACEDWTPISIYGKLARIVALLSGRVFVGRPLSRQEEWIQTSVEYTYYIMVARDAIIAYPAFLRSIVAPFVPELRKLKRLRARGSELMKPILDAQMAKEQNEKIRRDDTEDEQGTMISWILKHTPENKRRDASVLANNQMGLTFAAIHTTSMATTAAIYDLATYPEYIQPLREEIQQVLDEDGYDLDGDGFMKLKKPSMPKLWKLDSFLKESQRLTPPGIVNGNRIVTAKSLTLSTGHTLPKGTCFGFGTWAIQRSTTSPTFDPAQNPSWRPLDEFDGLRFYHLRQVAGNENKHQYATTSPDSLSFGHGSHACPGRFFAGNEIKVVVIELLRHWDFRLKGDVGGEGGVEKRPRNQYTGLACMPHTQAEMEFRRRSTK